MTMTAAERAKKWREEHPEVAHQKIKCCVDGCENLVYSDRKTQRKDRTGKCMVHAKRGKPFGPAYSRVRMAAKKKGFLCLSYEEFVEFTKTKQCHYCKNIIPWKAYYSENGEGGAQSYFLDRKDNSKGYEVENCVVCCTDCNIIKGARFDYSEFLLLAPVLEKIRTARRENGTDRKMQKVGNKKGGTELK